MLTKESLNRSDDKPNEPAGAVLVSPGWHISAKHLQKKVQQQLKLPSLPLPSVARPCFSKVLEGHALAKLDEHPTLPISIVSGELVFQVTDFTLPGPIAFAWRRVYRSSLLSGTGHGPGWVTPLSERLHISAGTVILTTSSGRLIEFKNPTIGSSCQHRQEKMLLTRQAEHSYLLSTIGCDDFRLFRADGVSDYLPLVEFRDGFNNSISVDYKRGQVQKLVSSWGRSIHFEHTDSGQIKSIHSHDLVSDTNPQGLLAHYGYSEAGALVEATDFSRSGECYAYEAGFLVSRDTQVGQSWHYSIESDSVPARYFQAECAQTGEIYQLKWRYKQLKTELRRGCDALWTYQLDNQGQIRQVSLPDGSVIRRLFDSYGNLCCESNGEGQAFYFRYNRSGQVTRMTDSLNRTTRIRYDDKGRPNLITDALNNHWQRRYGSAGELLEVRSPKASVWQFSYSAKGQLECVLDPEEAKTQFQWDSQFNLTQLIDAENNSTRFEYDHWQRLERVLDACGMEQSFTYDARGLLAQITQADLPVIKLQYSQVGLVTELAKGEQHRAQYHYQHGLLVALEDSRCGHAEFKYDKQLRLIEALNSTGLRFSTSYHPCGYVAEQNDFYGRHYRFEYNKAGQLIEYRDPEVITSLDRDQAGQLTRASNNSGDACDYHYDPIGRIIAANNREALIRYQYDSEGQLLSEHVDDQEFGSHSFEHQYDVCGRRIKTITDEIFLQYHYSPAGRFFGVDLNGETVLRRAYDACGRVLEQTQLELQSQFAYSDLGQLVAQSVIKTGVAEPIIERKYEYDVKGRLSVMDDKVFGPCQFSYNEQDKLIACDGTFAEQLSYNEQGLLNRVAESALSYSPFQLLEQLGDMSLKADKRGNLVFRSAGKTSPNSVTYNYTGWNQLSSIENGDFKTFYRYDALGRRLSKVVTHLKTKQKKKGSFRHNGQQLWSDIQLTPKGQRVQNYVLAPQNAELLAVVRDGELFAMHQDGRGYVCELTNAKAELVWKNQARLLGGVNRFHEKPQVSNPVRSAGLYTDSESGLNYVWQDGHHAYREPLSHTSLSAPIQTRLGPVSLWAAPSMELRQDAYEAVNLNDLRHLKDQNCAIAALLTDYLHFSKD
ncbi:DUF6531 domain-containing protein [Agaribacterium sp. ZY112]|uniref:DUF6531 domain-containing protein n=1 Tax=Agaribacterium sp. ZY112 TaxID=3233574 RepID=UPI0035233548